MQPQLFLRNQGQKLKTLITESFIYKTNKHKQPIFILVSHQLKKHGWITVVSFSINESEGVLVDLYTEFVFVK